MQNIMCIHSDEDIKCTADLASEIWNEYFISLIGKQQVDYMLEKFQSESAIKKALADGYKYYMIFFDNTPAGYCGVHLEDDGRLFLSKLYVKKEFRKRGFSTMMLKNAICDNKGAKAVYLTVNKYNENSIQVYHHIGFRITDSVVTDIDGGFVMDDYIMELKL